MAKPYVQKAALDYALSSQPLDPEKGWQREDVQLAFMAGMEDAGVRRLLTVPEVADLLSVSTSVIRDLVRYGELAYVHAGRGTERKHLTFSPDEIESFIKRHTQRDYYNPVPKTVRKTKRKSANELAVERVTDSAEWIARARAGLAAKKRKKP